MIFALIHYAFLIYTLIIMARLIASWFPSMAHTRFVQFLVFYTDPYLRLFRKIIPPLGILDLSPVVALIALQLAEKLIFYILSWLLIR